MIAQAAPYTFPTPISHLETPTVLPSFELIDRAKYAGRRVTVPIQIFGENTVAYHAPAKFTVSFCPLKRDNKCTGRKGYAGACMAEVVVPLGERVLIAGVRATDSWQQPAYGEWFGLATFRNLSATCPNKKGVTH